YQHPADIHHSGVLLMSKKKGKTPQPAAKTMTASAPKMEAFTFGEPVPVLDRRDILDYVECISNGRWYEPPVSFTGLAKSLRAAVHHSSPIYVKRNIRLQQVKHGAWREGCRLVEGWHPPVNILLHATTGIFGR
ncbi:hypothetical protein ACT4US_08055, partial [Bacillus sp. HC-Mk]